MIGRRVTLEQLEEHLKKLNPQRVIDRVIVHHFWKPTAADWKGIATLESVRDHHVRVNGWSDIGYHLVIGPDGSLWLARPMEQTGAHTVGQNSRSVGIAYAANFDSEDPAACGYSAGVKACAAIIKRFGCDEEDVYFHRDFAKKSCPGKKMDKTAYRRDVASILAAEGEDRFVRLKINDKLIVGACIVIKNGTATGLQGPLAAALGIKCDKPDLRVGVRKYLESHGAVIPPDGWHPEQGPCGTIYAYRKK